LGDLNAGVATLQTAVELRERRLPDDPGSRATVLRLLARVQVDNGQPDEALASIEQAFELGQVGFDPRSLDWADLNDLDGARRIYEEILVIEEREGRTEDQNYTTTVSNLAVLLAKMGELDAAPRRFEQALELDQARLGPEHPTVGQDMLNLGAIAQMAGDRKTAASALAGAAASLSKSLGPDHPIVGIAEGNLATVYTTLNRQEEAAPLFDRAIPKLEAGLGPKSPDLATFYNMHAPLLADVDELDAADARIDEALAQATTAERSGRDHFRTVARGQSERDALRLAVVRPSGLDAAIAAALELDTEAARGAAWDELVRSRALVLD
jgi:tetratricopeptide (TPR) repeat protein